MFPPQIKIQVVSYGTTGPVRADTEGFNFYKGLEYDEMDDLRYGDLGPLIARAQKSTLEFAIYITYDYDYGRQNAPTPSFHDHDEFKEEGIPDISLKFEDGRYVGFGLGGGPFANVVAKHFEPHKDSIYPPNWDKVLIAAIADGCKEIDIIRAAEGQD